MPENISCPVSHILINEYRVRITAGFVFLASLFWLLAPFWVIPAFLAIDFFLRASRKGQYSPLNILSGWLVRILSITNKPIDQAPKLFAAQLGFVFSSLLLLSVLFSLPTAAVVIATVLALFAFLESAFGFCAGCHVYSLIKSLNL